MDAKIRNEFLGDIKLSNLVLLGENHEFYPHFSNNMSIQNLLIEKAYKNRLNYNLALEHGDFNPNLSNEEAYQILQKDFSNTFEKFFRPLLDTVIRYRSGKIHLIGYHKENHPENNQKMAKHLNHIISKDSVTLAIIGQRHLGSNGSDYASVQSYIKPGFRPLTILQSTEKNNDIISRIDKISPNTPKYIIGI